MWEEAGLPRGTAYLSASMRGKIRALELLLSRGANHLRIEKIRSSEILGFSYEEAKSHGRREIMSLFHKHTYGHN